MQPLLLQSFHGGIFKHTGALHTVNAFVQFGMILL
jgi:hypothetical protein